MVFPDNPTVKATAAHRLQNVPNATRLVLIHSAIPAAITLVLTFISYLLSLQIADTGGLGGLGTRSLLETAQSMLQIIGSVFSVFWAYGYSRILLHWSRGERAWDADLLEGFRRFGPVLRTMLVQLFIYIGAVFLAAQLSSIVFAMTPLAENMYTLVEQMMEDPGFMPTEEAMLSAIAGYIPFLMAGLLVVLLPITYRLRLMDLALMDAPGKGAFYAMRTSLVMMRGNCMKMFKLDLSFWWFYLLDLLVTAVYYGDVLLQLFGVETGLSSAALMFAACAIGLAVQTGLYVWRKNQVMTAYAVVYDQLKLQLQVPAEQDTI